MAILLICSKISWKRVKMLFWFLVSSENMMRGTQLPSYIVRKGLDHSKMKVDHSKIWIFSKKKNFQKFLFFDFSDSKLKKRQRKWWQIFFLTNGVWHLVIFGQKMRIIDIEEFWRFWRFLMIMAIFFTSIKFVKLVKMIWFFRFFRFFRYLGFLRFWSLIKEMEVSQVR